MGNFLWSSTAPILNAISNSIDALWVLWLRVWLDWGWDVFIYLKVLWDKKTIFFLNEGGWQGVSWYQSPGATEQTQLPALSSRAPPHDRTQLQVCVYLISSLPLFSGFRTRPCIPLLDHLALCTWIPVHVSQTCHGEWIPGPRNNSGAGHSHSSERLWFQVWSWALGYM